MDAEVVLLTEEEAAIYLVLRPQTLMKWRHQQKGPPYIRLRTGTIRYDREELAAWALSERVTPGDGTAA